MPRLAVLGGSSPFTAAFVEALRDEGARDEGAGVPPLDLVLHGRSVTPLARMRAYAEHRLGPLGWTVRAETELAPALEGAAVVLHQIRYGGMQGREAGEAFCARFGVPADETLGPAALRTALELGPALARTADAIRACAPDATVLNLTNPLSCATALLAEAAPRSFGLCELPVFTVAEAAALFGLAIGAVDWEYAGLNHRGFVTALRHGGRDLLAELPARLGDEGTIGGVRAGEIAALGALPLKYHRLLTGEIPAPGRAAYLNGVRDGLLRELRDPARVPAGLGDRAMPWYAQAAVPVLAALLGGRTAHLTINLDPGDGMVEEVKAVVDEHGVHPAPAGEASPPAAAWLARFREHERAVMRAVRDPGVESVRAALAADPVVPAAVVERMADVLWADVQAGRMAEVAA
jgi:6-phospho-beta-glucosidase